jgi:hypothetical protein
VKQADTLSIYIGFTAEELNATNFNLSPPKHSNVVEKLVQADTGIVGITLGVSPFVPNTGHINAGDSSVLYKS